MFYVTDDFKADIRNILEREIDRELIKEYAVMQEVMQIDGVADSLMVDVYSDVMELMRDEICKRFCERVV